MTADPSHFFQRVKRNEPTKDDKFKTSAQSAKNKGLNKKVNMDFGGALSTGETWLTRLIVALVLIMIIYIVFSKMLANQMLAKEKEIKDYYNRQKTQISLIASDENEITEKTTKYKNLITDLKRTNEKISDVAARRNSIPNLLDQIMKCYQILRMI